MKESDILKLLAEVTPADLDTVMEQERRELVDLAPDEGLDTDRAWSWERISPDSMECRANFKSIAASSRDAEAIKQAREKAKADRKAVKRAIVNEALQSDTLKLSAPLSVADKRRAIELYTDKYTECMEGNCKYALRIIEAALRKAIPTDLLNCYAKYPMSIPTMPGFDYHAGKLYGKNGIMRVEPNIPLYFRPSDCQGILENMLTDTGKRAVDRSVANYVKHKEARARQEVRLAKSLVRCRTYMDLLKYSPELYKMLADDKKV